VVLKGGHGGGPVVEDFLVTPREVRAFRRPRLREARGTGCALSTSLACFLALGYPLGEAVRRAGDYVWRVLGKGYVPGRGKRVLGVEAFRTLG
jgi:hydroxymethylpyrimidine/phosphomethylpyrimidine kinase